MIEFIYILFALLIQQLYFYDDERGWLSDDVLIMGIFMARLMAAPLSSKKTMKITSLIAALQLCGLGTLVWMEYFLFLEAFRFGSVSDIQSYLMIKVPIEAMINAKLSSLKPIIYSFGIFTCSIGSTMYENNWILVSHIIFLAVNSVIVQEYVHMHHNLERWQREVYICLTGLFISIMKSFNGIDLTHTPSNNSYIVSAGILIVIFIINIKRNENMTYHWISSLIVSTLGSFYFGIKISDKFLFSTFAGHVFWFFYIKVNQKMGYQSLPVFNSVDTTNSSSVRLMRNILLHFLAILVIFYGLKKTSGISKFLARKRYFYDDESGAISNSAYKTIPPRTEPINYRDKILSTPSFADSTSCDELYGPALIKNFLKSKIEVCSSKSPAGTQISCYYNEARKGVSHIDFETLCEIRNFKFDLDRISTLKLPKNEKLYFWEMNSIKESTLGNCFMNNSSLTDKVNSEEPSAYLLNSYVHDSSFQCHEYFNKTILFINRWDTTNFYHATEDFLQAWVSMLVADIDPKDAIVVRLDTKLMGPFTSFFNYALSHKSIPKEEKVHVNRAQDIINIVDWAKNVNYSCFSRAVFGIFAVPSPVSFEVYFRQNTPTSCKPPYTSIFTSFKDYVIQAYGFIPDTDLKPRSSVHLTYISRKGFLREIKNEDYLLKEIAKAVCGTKSRCKLRIKVYDFQVIPFYQQIEIARNTDILLGMHGAALASTVYLPNSSMLMEIGHPTRFSNQHFQNLANFMGIRYQLFNGDDLLSDQVIREIAVSVREEMQRRKML